MCENLHAGDEGDVMNVGYVVLYVNDVDACAQFWTNQVGMVERERNQFAEHSVVRVGFSDQNF